MSLTGRRGFIDVSDISDRAALCLSRDEEDS